MRINGQVGTAWCAHLPTSVRWLACLLDLAGQPVQIGCLAGGCGCLRNQQAIAVGVLLTLTLAPTSLTPGRQVPEVHVTAKAFLPSTSLVTFELGAGLHFTTFVSTVPISGGWVRGMVDTLKSVPAE